MSYQLRIQDRAAKIDQINWSIFVGLKKSNLKVLSD